MNLFHKLRTILLQLLLLAVILELIFFFSFEDLIMSLMSVLTMVILNATFVRREIFIKYPLSSLTVLFYAICFIILPYYATLIEFKPISYNLRTPLWTFFNVIILLIILLLSHSIYRGVFSRKNSLREIIYRYKGFDSLSTKQYYFLVFASFLYYVVTIVVFGRYDEDGGNADVPGLVYIIGLIFGGYLPCIALLIYPRFGLITPPIKKTKLLIIMTVVCSAVGVMTNMRTAVLLVPTAILGCLLLNIIYLNFNIDKKTKKVFVIAGLLTLIITPVFLRISTIMLIMRGDRYGLSGRETMDVVLDLATNEDAIKSFLLENRNDEEDKNESDYSEKYLNNDALARFCSLKIYDETLFHAEKIGYSQAGIRKDISDYFFSIFPEALVVPAVLSHEERVEAAKCMSLTDRLCYISTGKGLGGARIGSFQGIGLAAFGWLYVPIMFVICIIIFFLFDSLVYIKDGKIIFSYYSIICLPTILLFFQPHHVYTFELKYIIRTFWEQLLFYLLTINIIKSLKFLK